MKEVDGVQELTELQRRLAQEAVAFGYAKGKEVTFRRLQTNEPVLVCKLGDALGYFYTDAFQFEVDGRVHRLESDEVPTPEMAVKAFSGLLRRSFGK